MSVTFTLGSYFNSANTSLLISVSLFSRVVFMDRIFLFQELFLKE